MLMKNGESYSTLMSIQNIKVEDYIAYFLMKQLKEQDNGD